MVHRSLHIVIRVNSSMRSSIQEALLFLLTSVLKPRRRLMLLLGVGYRRVRRDRKRCVRRRRDRGERLNVDVQLTCQESRLLPVSRERRLVGFAQHNSEAAMEPVQARSIQQRWCSITGTTTRTFAAAPDEARPLPFQGPSALFSLGRPIWWRHPSPVRCARTLLQSGTVEEVMVLLIAR